MKVKQIETGQGLHVAIIMDGNGRWATARSCPRIAGHRAGADSVRRTVEAAPKLGVRVLTLYAFSSANWERPRTEVDGLMFLFRRYLFTETRRCIDESIRMSVIGLLIGLPISIAALRFGLRRGIILAPVTNVPLVGIAIGLVVLTVASAATWFPARRAATVDPAMALKAE